MKITLLFKIGGGGAVADIAIIVIIIIINIIFTVIVVAVVVVVFDIGADDIVKLIVRRARSFSREPMVVALS